MHAGMNTLSRANSHPLFSVPSLSPPMMRCGRNIMQDVQANP